VNERFRWAQVVCGTGEMGQNNLGRYQD
jgi:hypothetical protein